MHAGYLCVPFPFESIVHVGGLMERKFRVAAPGKTGWPYKFYVTHRRRSGLRKINWSRSTLFPNDTPFPSRTYSASYPPSIAIVFV